MAGLPWFQLDTDFADSPKVVALAARLREPLADAYVARLYAYCYRHARDRFDAEVAVETIEVAVRWKGRRGTLTDALHAVGVLEREAGKVVVHGVKERLAPHLSKRMADAARQRKHREAAPESRVSHAGVTVDVTPDVTRESRSEREKEREIETEATTSSEAKEPIALLPCVGRVSEFAVTEQMVAEWQTAYPGVAVIPEVLRAVQWCRDNPTRRKTAAGARRFLGSWMARQQNEGRPNGKQPQAPRPPDFQAAHAVADRGAWLANLGPEQRAVAAQMEAEASEAAVEAEVARRTALGYKNPRAGLPAAKAAEVKP